MLEFIKVTKLHNEPALATISIHLANKLKIRAKLFAFCGDNTSNNRTLCNLLFKSLKKTHNNNLGACSTKPTMQFHGQYSWIYCKAYIIALICGNILKDLKAKTAKDAKKLLDSWDKLYNTNTY